MCSLLEEGGTVFTFEGTRKKSFQKTVIRVHHPQFYWKASIISDIYHVFHALSYYNIWDSKNTGYEFCINQHLS